MQNRSTLHLLDDVWNERREKGLKGKALFSSLIPYTSAKWYAKTSPGWKHLGVNYGGSDLSHNDRSEAEKHHHPWWLQQYHKSETVASPLASDVWRRPTHRVHTPKPSSQPLFVEREKRWPQKEAKEKKEWTRLFGIVNWERERERERKR